MLGGGKKVRSKEVALYAMEKGKVGDCSWRYQTVIVVVNPLFHVGQPRMCMRQSWVEYVKLEIISRGMGRNDLMFMAKNVVFLCVIAIRRTSDVRRKPLLKFVTTILV